MHSGSVRLTSDPLLADVSLPYSHTVYPLGFPVNIVTNDERVLIAAIASWPGEVAPRSERVLTVSVCVTNHHSDACPPAPTAHARSSVVVFTADAQNHFVCQIETGTALGWIAQSTLQHDLYLRYHLLEGSIYTLVCTTHVTALHAACVSWEGVGILLCGEAGAGKSSLAYACARDGWAYTSDDACYLQHAEGQPVVLGKSYQFRFRPTARDLFPELSDREITPRAEGKPSIEIPTSELPWVRPQAEAQVEFLVFLKRHLAAETELVPISRAQAIERLEAGNYPNATVRERQRNAIQRLADRPAFELRYRDLHAATARLQLLAGRVKERVA